MQRGKGEVWWQERYSRIRCETGWASGMLVVHPSEELEANVVAVIRIQQLCLDMESQYTWQAALFH